MILTRWIEHALDVTLDRLRDTDPRERDRAAVLSRLRQAVRRRLHLLDVMLGLGDDLAEVSDSLA